MKKKVILVCGTRPEIIKMAPVYKALRESDLLTPAVLHTGQHTDLAKPLYQFFDMPPDYSIELVRSTPSLASLSVGLLAPIAQIFEKEPPAAVLVHGDTSSSVMAALAAFYEKIPVGHVEAGLRTGEKYSPFPEEMNRQLTGRLAEWHYAPTNRAKDALLAENIQPSRVLVTGNSVIDAALLTSQMLESGHKDEFIESHSLASRIDGKRLILVTAHRRENWGTGLEEIATAVAEILQEKPDVFVVWPLHANPDVARTVRKVFTRMRVDESRLVLAPPLDYPALVWLLHKSWIVMTDSGGIQEEAAAFGAPVLILRDSTERPELIEAGGGVLVGAVKDSIRFWFHQLESDAQVLFKMRNIANPFGAGTTGAQITKHLEAVL